MVLLLLLGVGLGLLLCSGLVIGRRVGCGVENEHRLEPASVSVFVPHCVEHYRPDALLHSQPSSRYDHV